MKRLLAAVGAGVLAAAAAAMSPPVPSPVDVLIARLGSESFAEREAAASALEATGPAAIPALDAAARDPNPEVGRRAGEVLARLRRTTDSKDRLAAKKVKLAYKAVPLGTAVNDLKARTGINLTLDSANVADPLRPVTCETGELPVWEAVAAFCQAAGLKEVFAAELPVPKQEHAARSRRTYYAPPPPPIPETVPVTLADGKYVPLPGSRSTAVRVLALPASFPNHRVYLGTGDVLLHFDVAPVPNPCSARSRSLAARARVACRSATSARASAISSGRDPFSSRRKASVAASRVAFASRRSSSKYRRSRVATTCPAVTASPSSTASDSIRPPTLNDRFTCRTSMFP